MNIIKKLFIKLSKIIGYELIDQNDFKSPTLEKELNEDLSILNDKSIVLPLGEVKISRKVKSLLILFRTNSNIEIWDQNKRRLFELPKIEYTLRSLNSVLKSINFCKEKYTNLEIKLISTLFLAINSSILEIFSFLELFSTIIVLKFILGYFIFEKLIDLISEFKDLKVYSIFGNSNNLFLF